MAKSQVPASEEKSESTIGVFFLHKTVILSIIHSYALLFYSNCIILLCYKVRKLMSKFWKTVVSPTQRRFRHFSLFVIKLDHFIVNSLFPNVTNTQA